MLATSAISQYLPKTSDPDPGGDAAIAVLSEDPIVVGESLVPDHTPLLRPQGTYHTEPLLVNRIHRGIQRHYSWSHWIASTSLGYLFLFVERARRGLYVYTSRLVLNKF